MQQVTVISQTHPVTEVITFVVVLNGSLSREQIYKWGKGYLDKVLNSYMGGNYSMFIHRESLGMLTTITYAEEHCLPIVFTVRISGIQELDD